MTKPTAQIDDESGDWLTRQEAADLLGITVVRLAQLRRAGEIVHYKNPQTRAVRFKLSDVKQLKARRAIGVASRP